MSLCLYLTYKIRIIKNRKLCIEFHTISSVLMGNALKSPHEVKMPECSSELAICDRMESKFLLFCNNLGNLLIDNFVELLLGDLSVPVCCLRILECLWSQKASYKIVSERCL